MTKGPVALVLIGGFFAAAWLVGGELRELSRGLHWGRGLLLATLAASPWFVWMHGRFGPAFVQGYILAGNVFYLTQPAGFSGRAVSHTFYLRAFLGGFFPWTIVMLGRGVDLLRRSWTGLALGREEKLLWLWVALVIGFFSAARFKLDHYIFPAAPACCLIAAKAWHDAAALRNRQIAGTRASLLVMAALFIAGGAFVATSMFELDLDLPEAAILLPITLAVGGAIVLARSARREWQVPARPLAVLTTMVAIYAIVVTLGFPTLQRTRPTALVGRTVHDRTPPGSPVGIYNLERWRASLRYYSERPLARLATIDDVSTFFAAGEKAYVIMTRADYRELRQRGLPRLREVFQCRAVVGTSKARSGLRRQRWDDLLIYTSPSGRGGLPPLP